MIQFGSTGIVAGYIKQLLADFPLPKTQIYTTEHEKYFLEHGKESPYILETTFPGQVIKDVDALPSTDTSTTGDTIEKHCYVPYIKDGRIQFLLGGYYLSNNHYVQGKWQSAPFDVNASMGGEWRVYNRGDHITNLTRSLEIKNNIYDSYTHEYLGEYLRFLRDYDGINLMSMYNCFSNRRPYRMEYKDETITLNSLDSNYKIYMLPVKLFREYTIAIDSPYPVEICCGIHAKNNARSGSAFMTNDLEQRLTDATYQRFASMRFNDPVLYTKLTELATDVQGVAVTSEDRAAHKAKRTLLAELGPQADELKLYIKLHRNTESTITILEGNYLGWNDFGVGAAPTKKNTQKLAIKANHTVISNEAIFAEEEFDLIAPVQLLKFNTGTHTPFASRLLEYLLDQSVTGGPNEVRENVLMAQYLAGLRHNGSTRTTRLENPPPLKKAQPTGEDTNLFWELGGKLTNIPVTVNPKYKYYPDVTDTSKPGSWTIYGEGYAESPVSPVPGTTLRIKPQALNYDLLNGVWTPALRKIFYNYMSNRSDFISYPDILGYVDRDVENLFSAKIPKGDKLVTKTMLDFNAWEDIKE